MSISLLLALACGDGSPAGGADSAGATTATPDTEVQALARCDYENPFSGSAECKEYVGPGWDLDLAAEDCQTPVIAGDPGVLTEGASCDRDEVLAECIVDGGGEVETVTVFSGTDPGACSGAELGCSFAGGEFVPGEVCLSGEDGEGVPPEQAFVPFEQVCVDPLEGEPAGDGPDGQVCTWQAISGSTEEGRHFADYASCEVVRSQRPYYAASASADTSEDDARLQDEAWVEDYAWVTAQVEASACVCCHSTEHAPSGTSGWYLEAGPIWLDSVDDDGLAMLAGWVDSTVFGAFPPEDNNGFSRDRTGLPTTDPDRLAAFLEGELARRGLGRDDFADTEPFGGVLYEQLFHEPEPCGDGQGVAADGTVSWTGGPARYLYVLEEDSMSPGVPPNLDLPDGTLWRLDVSHTADPVASGVAYGSVPDGAAQAWPLDAEAPALVSGQTYYLVSLLDIYQPATRCLFTAG